MTVLQLSDQQAKDLEGVDQVVVTGVNGNTLYAGHGTTIIKVLLEPTQVGEFKMGNTLLVDGNVLTTKVVKANKDTKSNPATPQRAGMWPAL